MKPEQVVWLVVPRVPFSLNVMLRMHRYARRRDNKSWEDEIFVAVPINERRNWIKMRFEKDGALGRMRLRAEIQVVWEKRRLDPDGLAGAVKPILDAMRKTGLIYNDSAKWLELITTQTLIGRVGGKPRTEISVQRALEG